MIAINTKTIYIEGTECVQADFLATETPDAMPESTTDGMLGVKVGVPIYAGSTVWCADTGKKWILFDIGSWVNSADTTEPFSNGGGGGK